MHYIFNHSWIVEVLLALPGVSGMVLVAVLLAVRGEVTVHVVGWGGVGWGGARGGTRHMQHKPISIIINHKFIRPSAISMPRDVSPSQNGQLILAQPKFHTLYKSCQCSPKQKLFSDFWVSYDRWDLQPSIHIKNSRKCFTFFIWQTIQKCQLFFGDTW